MFIYHTFDRKNGQYVNLVTHFVLHQYAILVVCHQ